MRYDGAQAIAVRGPITGRAYITAGPGSIVRVHVADAPALLRTSLFVDEPA